MQVQKGRPMLDKPTHDWMRKIKVALVPGPDASNVGSVLDGILRYFQLLGHDVQNSPTADTDVLLTTARYGEPVSWREALMFVARKRFQMNHIPTVYTIVHMRRKQFQDLFAHFEQILQKTPPDPSDYNFIGLSADGYRILFEQGTRGGPILAIERLLQAWTKSVHVLLVVGDEQPEVAYHFDLVGAYPQSYAEDLEDFYRDIVLRIVTTLSTHEVTQHTFVGEKIPYRIWADLETPKAMSLAGQELGQRSFFTDMVRISDLVPVPAITEGISSQYSEGCFSTWDPQLNALVATVTGSARPVYKGKISDDDLAILVGIREDGLGALIRHVEGKQNYSPSSESVEMMEMDSQLPRITLDPSWNISGTVPVIRSKLHGHRGIAVYDPTHVEFVPLDPPYYYYLVSCATAAQAQGIRTAFARSEALQNPDDPRQIVFTILPGHGAVIVEKWVYGKRPFQVLREAMDAGILEVSSRVPQGPMSYVIGASGHMSLR